jgi:pyruvate dehydrogenase E2 component (dihydrolipoamide acetyltransferase)
MPRLSDTMREGTLAEWKKAEGDKVAAGEALADIETDKAVMTFESFDDGVLLKCLIQPGDTVGLGTPIAVLGKAGEDITALCTELEPRIKAAKAAAAAVGEAIPKVEEAAPEPAAEPQAPEPTPKDAAGPAVTLRGGGGGEEPPSGIAPPATNDQDGIRIKSSPLARRLAAERGIDLGAVAGSGPGGRIIKRDLEGLEPTRRVLGGVRAQAPSREDELIRVTQIRKTIAKRLVESVTQAPHFYLNLSVDGARLVELREDANAIGLGPKLSFNDFVMRAVVLVLQDHPEVNAAWEGAQIRRYGPVHLGFAVATDQGLLAPVVRHAERLGIAELAAEVRRLAAKARVGGLDTPELTGNSFCVSNLGMYGIDRFTAILNPPAACILAVGAVRELPVVQAGVVVAGKRMDLTLTCDHRVVDGAMGAAFLADLKPVLERPLRTLL